MKLGPSLSINRLTTGGESSAPLSPLDIASVAYWLDSRQNIVGSSPVTSWTDRKLAKTFTNGGSPVLVASSPPRIQLNSVPDCIQASSVTAVNYTGGNRAAMTFAFRTRTSFNNAAILSYGGSSNHFAIGISSSGVLKGSRSSTWTDDVVDTTPLNQNTLYVASLYYSGGELVLRKNSVEVARAANAFSFGSWDYARFGGLSDGANFSQSADAIQIAYFNSSFTLTDIINVENHFKTLIGI